MSRPSKAMLYALEEPGAPPVVRYVGACGYWGSGDTPQAAAFQAEHQLRYTLCRAGLAMGRERTRVERWIEHLRAKGQEPTIRVLEVVPADQRKERRRYWEKLYTSTRLTNWCPTGEREERWNDTKRAEFSTDCKRRGQSRNFRGATARRPADAGGGGGDRAPDPPGTLP